jgi:hypothetical protein
MMRTAMKLLGKKEEPKTVLAIEGAPSEGEDRDHEQNDLPI